MPQLIAFFYANQAFIMHFACIAAGALVTKYFLPASKENVTSTHNARNLHNRKPLLGVSLIKWVNGCFMHSVWTPLEQFEVVPLVSLVTGGGSIWPLTNHGLYIFIAAAIVVMLPCISIINSAVVPTRWGVAMEVLYTSVYTLVVGNLGGRVHAGLFPALFTLFTIILVSNLTSNIPYSHAPTASVATDLGLSFTIWLTTLAVGLQLHGLHFFAFFVPGGTPLGLVPMLTLIETISYVSRAVSLGVRLFANMVAGHALLVILASFIGPLLISKMFPIGFAALVVFIGIQALELAVAFIQAYVLVVLSSSYARDAIELH